MLLRDTISTARFFVALALAMGVASFAIWIVALHLAPGTMTIDASTPFPIGASSRLGMEIDNLQSGWIGPLLLMAGSIYCARGPRARDSTPILTKFARRIFDSKIALVSLGLLALVTGLAHSYFRLVDSHDQIEQWRSIVGLSKGFVWTGMILLLIAYELRAARPARVNTTDRSSLPA